MMTDKERKRLRELNSKNEEFNKQLYENARSYAKRLVCAQHTGIANSAIIFVIISDMNFLNSLPINLTSI